MRTLLAFVVALGTAAVPAAAQNAPTASELAARVQAHYVTVKDFTADFTLMQTSSRLPKVVEERGQVLLGATAAARIAQQHLAEVRMHCLGIIDQENPRFALRQIHCGSHPSRGLLLVSDASSPLTTGSAAVRLTRARSAGTT